MFRNVTVGAGPSPQATDTVKVNYRGTFMNGTEFDSSYKRNAPIDFQLNRVIKCWTEGVQMMKVGGKRFWSARQSWRTATNRRKVFRPTRPLRLKSSY